MGALVMMKVSRNNPFTRWRHHGLNFRFKVHPSYRVNNNTGIHIYILDLCLLRCLSIVEEQKNHKINQSISTALSTMKIILISVLLICCIYTCSSSPVSISDGIFSSEASIGRNLLQAKKPCPVDFEFMNYTIITSRCKGPRYPANLCCDAFKDFACPYSDDLNDLSNECASTMFSYINLYGNYPPGLFSSLCRDDKIGLICPSPAPGAQKNNVVGDSNISHNIRSSSVLMLTAGFLILLFLWI